MKAANAAEVEVIMSDSLKQSLAPQKPGGNPTGIVELPGLRLVAANGKNVSLKIYYFKPDEKTSVKLKK